jgi:hypothetical protein
MGCGVWCCGFCSAGAAPVQGPVTVTLTMDWGSIWHSNSCNGIILTWGRGDGISQ